MDSDNKLLTVVFLILELFLVHFSSSDDEFSKYGFLKILRHRPELVGFQTLVIIDPYGMTFDAVGIFCPDL